MYGCVSIAIAWFKTERKIVNMMMNCKWNMKSNDIALNRSLYNDCWSESVSMTKYEQVGLEAHNLKWLFFEHEFNSI